LGVSRTVSRVTFIIICVNLFQEELQRLTEIVRETVTRAKYSVQLQNYITDYRRADNYASTPHLA